MWSWKFNNVDPIPFIHDQGLSQLELPRGLSLSQRFDTIAEALRHVEHRESPAPQGTERSVSQFSWKQLTESRELLLQRIVTDDAFRYLAIVDAAGMGKTTQSARLLYELTRPQIGRRCYPFWREAAWFADKDNARQAKERFIESLHEEMRYVCGRTTPGLESFRRLLDHAEKAGQLILIVDGLDQAPGRLMALEKLLDAWPACRVILTGRPYAFGLSEHQKDLLRRNFRAQPTGEVHTWSYLRLEPFDVPQRQRFLTVPGEATSRYDERKLSDSIKAVLGVPRLINTLRRIRREEFDQLRTPADLFAIALEGLLIDGMISNPEARLEPKSAPEDNAPVCWRVLATAAFIQTAQVVHGADQDGNPTWSANFGAVRGDTYEDFLDDVWSRVQVHVQKLAPDIRTGRELFEKLAQLNSTVARGDLLVTPRHQPGIAPGDQERFRFTNKSWQEFLTAVYLARFATPADREIVWRQCWIEQWDVPSSKQYHEIWQYFCDLQLPNRDPMTWLDTVELLYRPRTKLPSGAWEDAQRSPFWIYNTWWELNRYADDKTAQEWVPTAGQTKEKTTRELAIAQRARDIREAWWGEFEGILRGEQGVERQDAARQLTADFLTIPAGEVWFGTNITSGWASERPHPSNPLSVPEYQLARRPTTNAWLRLFAPQHGLRDRSEEDYERISPSLDHPAIFVDWYLAWASCLFFRWAEQCCCLPSELEFERAAKYGMDREAQLIWDYWWSPWWHPNEFHRKFCHCKQSWEVGTVLSASSIRASEETKALDHLQNPMGIMDLLGNVLEWQGDIYRVSYELRFAEDSRIQSSSNRSSRGGAWSYSPKNCRMSWRYTNTPSFRDFDTGFRLARD